jgi:glycosyltransferase involved in cell wall biosynthesis
MRNQPGCTQPILFVHNAPTTFVVIDRQLLQERWPVQEWYQRDPRFNLPALVRAVRGCGLVLAWFAGWHSLLPVLLARWLGKPALVVVGGYDTANLPEANYGSQRGGLRRLIARSVIRQATHLITNSESARQEAVSNAQADPAKITVIYHGLPPLPAGPLTGREPIALTVGNLWQENLLRKGLQPFVETAAYLPEVKFVHVGKWHDGSIDTLRRLAGPNVEFKGFVSDDDLVKLYHQAAVYVQASLHEGFGMSVAEAMLGGCIPAVTRCGALPEVVGETGVYTESNRPPAVAEAIRQALSQDGAARQAARERILSHFSLERRRAALAELVGRALRGERGVRSQEAIKPSLSAER